MRAYILAIVTTVVAVSGIQSAVASPIVYRPVNPSFGGDPLNGNWLLSQASAQTSGSDSPGFSIDFPDFGNVAQPAADPIDLPPVETPDPNQ